MRVAREKGRGIERGMRQEVGRGRSGQDGLPRPRSQSAFHLRFGQCRIGNLLPYNAIFVGSSRRSHSHAKFLESKKRESVVERQNVSHNEINELINA